MNPVLRQEEEIFDTARQIADAAERCAYLDHVCAGDMELRSRLEELLLTADDAEAFFAVGSSAVQSLSGELQALTKGTMKQAEGDEQVGRRIGNYKLLERIGEGGCGVVYMAEQEKPVRRRVALKIIKLGMDTRSVIARFEAERQALAMMDHPNIARVLEAGATETGRPYFVMELVRGFKITEYCDANELDTHQRLDLFIQVCQAIQHAHQKGIIHRDIKPSNILVTLHDGVPVPKVIDFGIAKATETQLTEKTLFTAYAQVIGTPAYMSPEQAEMSGLDVDTRADIYSLGVLLYELLTGRTPFDAKQLMESGFDGMRRTLMEREPQKPSRILTTLQNDELTAAARHRHAEPPRLISELRGDLDWIVMRALEKDRKRRYETANGLAMDIERYLNHEPVVARPPSRLYRLEKLARRNRGVFAAAGAVIFALIVGFALSTWMFLREREARERAVASERQQARLREQAEQAKAVEAEKRQRAEAREKVTQAAVLLGEEDLAGADRLLAEIPPSLSLAEGTAVFRAAGEWNALRGDWAAAADRFQMLLRVEKVETLDRLTFDQTCAAAAFLANGDTAGYERYRRDVLARFADTTDATFAERTIKHALLRPADKKLLDRLLPLTSVVSNSIAPGEPAWKLPWRALSMALFDYRNGNHEEAVRWGQRGLNYSGSQAAPGATIRVILAMAYSHLGQIGDARAELDRGREMIEARFRPAVEAGDGAQGFWFDWELARLLLREAVTVVGETPHSLARPSE